MAKYTQEIKDKAVEMVQNGVSLKEIQRTLGPNPKAVERYLLKAGIAKPKAVKAPKEVAPAQKGKKNKKNAEPVEEDF